MLSMVLDILLSSPPIKFRVFKFGQFSFVDGAVENL